MRMLLPALSLVALPLVASGQMLRVAPRPAVQPPAPLRIEDATVRAMLETSKSAQDDLQALMGAM